MRRPLRSGRAALVLVLLGACYGADPDLLDDQQDALVDPTESAPPDEQAPDAESALAEDAKDEQVANMLRELESLYADPERARTREQQAHSELEQGADVDPDAVAFARLLAEQLQAADPDQTGEQRESDTKSPASDAGLGPGGK